MMSGCSPRFNSITIRMPSRSLSSRISLMPSIFFSFTRKAMFSIRRALFTWKGSSVTMIDSLPFSIFSVKALARILMEPRPPV